MTPRAFPAQLPSKEEHEETTMEYEEVLKASCPSPSHSPCRRRQDAAPHSTTSTGVRIPTSSGSHHPCSPPTGGPFRLAVVLALLTCPLNSSPLYISTVVSPLCGLFPQPSSSMKTSQTAGICGASLYWLAHSLGQSFHGFLAS